MSDIETATELKSGAWTEAAKLQFVLRVLAQFRDEGKSINWTKINMPGRTTKSLQNMWTKINKEITALEDGNADTPTPTPKKAGPRKPRAKKPATEDADNNDGIEAANGVKPKRVTGKKRAAGDGTAAKDTKKAKSEEGAGNPTAINKGHLLSASSDDNVGPDAEDLEFFK